jgi:hypothetical protein
MTFTLFDDASLVSLSYHAAVFGAVVVVLLAIQWLLDKSRR